MPVADATWGELTQPFRWIDKQDADLLAAFPLARAVEVPTFFSNMTELEQIAEERFWLLSEYRRRFEVTVEGCDYIKPSDFEGTCPGTLLKCAKYGLSAGRRMLIVKFLIDYGANETRLTLWG